METSTSVISKPAAPVSEKLWSVRRKEEYAERERLLEAAIEDTNRKSDYSSSYTFEVIEHTDPIMDPLDVDIHRRREACNDYLNILFQKANTSGGYTKDDFELGVMFAQFTDMSVITLSRVVQKQDIDYEVSFNLVEPMFGGEDQPPKAMLEIFRTQDFNKFMPVENILKAYVETALIRSLTNNDPEVHRSLSAYQETLDLAVERRVTVLVGQYAKNKKVFERPESSSEDIKDSLWSSYKTLTSHWSPLELGVDNWREFYEDWQAYDSFDPNSLSDSFKIMRAKEIYNIQVVFELEDTDVENIFDRMLN